MSNYKVKLGEQIVTVEGLAGLVKLVQEGRLSPEDPVFIPSTNRWHYARSVRQLREYFPGTPEPPREETAPQPKPAPAPKPENERRPRAAIPPLPPLALPSAEVVPFRPPTRYEPEGRFEVPIFNYDVDAGELPETRIARRVLLIAFSLFLGGAIFIYIVGYSSYLKSFEQSIELPTPPKGERTATPVTIRMEESLAESNAKSNAKSNGKGTGKGTPAGTRAVAGATQVPTVAATPVAITFDERAALEKVRKAFTTRVNRPADLGDAIKKDLTKLAVPVRTLAFVPKKGGKGTAVPFVGVVEYVRTDKTDDAEAARHRYMIVAMIGRRAVELNLRLDGVQVSTIKGKTRSEMRVSADLVRRIWDGTASAADLR